MRKGNEESRWFRYHEHFEKKENLITLSFWRLGSLATLCWRTILKPSNSYINQWPPESLGQRYRGDAVMRTLNGGYGEQNKASIRYSRDAKIFMGSPEFNSVHLFCFFSSLVILSMVHTSDISIRTRSIRKQRMISPQGLAKIKKNFSLFRLLFGSWLMLMTLCLWLRRSLCRRLDFIPVFCLFFCPYAYAYAHVWTRLYRIHFLFWNKDIL